MTYEQMYNLTHDQKEAYYKWVFKTAKAAKKISNNSDRIYFVICQYAKKFKRSGMAYEEIIELLNRSECREKMQEMQGETIRQGRYTVEFNAGLDNIYLK